MKPVLALVGRPNVGKSTLFNRLTRTRAALVADFPGLTRDRHYGEAIVSGRAFIVVDTGGLDPAVKAGIFSDMAQQTELAIAEADFVLFITDARAGVTAHDHFIAERLRSLRGKVRLVVNKVEGSSGSIATAEFHELGLGQPIAISASHNQGVTSMIEEIIDQFDDPALIEEQVNGGDYPKIAIVGRPNVGKSTLINAVLGENRVIAFDQPGTTRDSIHIDFHRGDRHYVLIDTAGVRRRGRVSDVIEKYSVIKTLQSIDEATVVILVLDADSGVTDQDAHLAGYILEKGRALVVALNKWDVPTVYQRDLFNRAVSRKLNFLSYSRFHRISAKSGLGLDPLLRSVDKAYKASIAALPTPRLTRVLLGAVTKQQPPRNGVTRPKMRFAHQGGQNPPVIIIHGSALQSVPETYRRYLESEFRSAFSLEGTPLRVEFRSGKNPYI